MSLRLVTFNVNVTRGSKNYDFFLFLEQLILEHNYFKQHLVFITLHNCGKGIELLWRIDKYFIRCLGSDGLCFFFAQCCDY